MAEWQLKGLGAGLPTQSRPGMCGVVLIKGSWDGCEGEDMASNTYRVFRSMICKMRTAFRGQGKVGEF